MLVCLVLSFSHSFLFLVSFLSPFVKLLPTLLNMCKCSICALREGSGVCYLSTGVRRPVLQRPGGQGVKSFHHMRPGNQPGQQQEKHLPGCGSWCMSHPKHWPRCRWGRAPTTSLKTLSMAIRKHDSDRGVVQSWFFFGTQLQEFVVTDETEDRDAAGSGLFHWTRTTTGRLTRKTRTFLSTCLDTTGIQTSRRRRNQIGRRK